MKKKTIAKLAGFGISAACAAALVGFAANGTGAYFTDSHTGEIDASTGSVGVNISPSDGKLAFTNLLPGSFQDVTVTYQTTGTGPEDIWLVFPQDGTAEAFEGKADDAGTGPLGRYGHFALSSTGGANFTSYNLANAGTTPGHTGTPCSTDPTTGWGGSNLQPTTPTDTTTATYCAPPAAILLQSNMNPTDVGSAVFTFGFTKLLKAPQSAPLAKVVNYKIVATQHGIAPNDPFNG
jgi:hypothetical protein